MPERFRCGMTPIIAVILLLTSVSFAAGEQPIVAAQAQKDPAQKDSSSAARVTVEVKKTEGKEGPDVKVLVDGKEAKQGNDGEKGAESPTFLPVPGEKLTPIEAEKINKAAQQVGKKVDEIGFRLGLKWGQWVWTEAFLGITWLKILAVVAAITLVILLDRSIRWYIRKRLSRPAEEQREETWKELLLDAASKPLSLLILVYGVYAAVSPLLEHFARPGATNIVREVAGGFADLGGTVAVLWLLYRLLRSVEAELRRRVSAQARVDDLLVTVVGRSLRIVVILLGAIFVVQNLTGLEMGPLLASLGLGGLAVALAAKDSIANFFGTLTIIFDHPFRLGEHIRVDKYEGVVEAIGFRSTRIRTFDGALVSIPNEKAVNSGVENVGRRPTIRWHTNLGLKYGTHPEKVVQAVEMVSEILQDDEHMMPDFPPRVFFNGFNDWSLNIAIFAWYEPAVWWDYQAWVQDKCLQIMRKFEEEGIELAFPTQTVFVENNEKSSVSLRINRQRER